MAQREELFRIQIITDCDTGMYKMGEIDTMVENQISKYINRYGETAYDELKEFCTGVLAFAREEIIHKRMAETDQAMSGQ